MRVGKLALSKELSGTNRTSTGSNSILLRAVGDIMVIAGAAAAVEQHGCDYPFGAVADLIRPADLAFGNLEMPICSNPQRKPAFPDVCPDFYSSPQIVEVLKKTGFHVINLANNHTMDWGNAGLQETLARLQEAGLKTIGAGANLAEARRPAIFNCNNLKVGFLGYSEGGPWVATPTQPGVAPLDRQMIREDVRSLRPRVDLVIVSLHTGILADYPSPEDRRLAQEAVDSGADLILGHGPHVLQGIETYHDRAIVYSMGNFMIDLSSGNVENKTMLREHLDSAIITASLVPGAPPKVDFIPVVISDTFQVLPADSEAAARIRARVERISKGLGQLTGLALWEHAGALNVEHQLRVMAFQWREVSWLHVLSRLKKVRWRHIRLVLGYVVSRLRQKFGHQAATG